ncbi:MAG: hypothetical protein CMC44_03265 [Flavobacteriaceae bacterium]|nr:hypothetical protein [Flavobacteriaceae bacterium]
MILYVEIFLNRKSITKSNFKKEKISESLNLFYKGKRFRKIIDQSLLGPRKTQKTLRSKTRVGAL